MIQRYLAISDVPELRPEPIHSERTGPEMQLSIPIDVFWEIQDVIKKIRYARVIGNSTEKHWSVFSRLVYPCLVLEKDRVWFKKNIG